MVLGFEDSNMSNTHPAIETRQRKTNKLALEFIYLSQKFSFSWTGLEHKHCFLFLVFFCNSPSGSFVQPGVKATGVCKRTLDDILQ